MWVLIGFGFVAWTVIVGLLAHMIGRGGAQKEALTEKVQEMGEWLALVDQERRAGTTDLDEFMEIATVQREREGAAPGTTATLKKLFANGMPTPDELLALPNDDFMALLNDPELMGAIDPTDLTYPDPGRADVVMLGPDDEPPVMFSEVDERRDDERWGDEGLAGVDYGERDHE